MQTVTELYDALMAHIEPCPVCGSRDAVVMTPLTRCCWEVYCLCRVERDDCPEYGQGGSLEQAVEAWNGLERSELCK